MRNYKSTGGSITIIAVAATLSGAPVLAGNLFGVAQHDAAIGEPLTIVPEGVFTLPKDSAAVFTVGEEVWLDATTHSCGEKASTKHLIGVAVVAAGNGTTSVDVRLNGTSTTVAA